ncbi:protein translocase component YidC, partial [Candidatus Desantisbacteria bacterium CG_4_10_14_0_8_um_filter_39_17]
IILLSGLIKIVLFPLTRVSLKSMKKMQKIQPQIAMLRQRFKHDPQALNRETMELYKRMKINPMGGCLPMIFQLPIFFALFTVLRDAIELRHSPFIFWIRDLSSKDPYYVLPILMGVTTFIQQKMTATDQQQKPMMTYFMTIFLTVIFLNFPAGLVLYWLITNILSIGEQKLIAKIS